MRFRNDKMLIFFQKTGTSNCSFNFYMIKHAILKPIDVIWMQMLQKTRTSIS